MTGTRCWIVGCIIMVLLGMGCVMDKHNVPGSEAVWDDVDNQGNQVGGIVFFNTLDLAGMKEFYMERVGCELWLDQGSCLIFQHGNQLLGFCQGRSVQKEGVLTFFYLEKALVDRIYEKFKESAESAPKMNAKYKIYHFYAKDPEGRSLEFQYFDHPLEPFI
ncbi:MAG: VOC family protein [Planctomycetes bacterium]|nr:VOC family protein [Planctomycetota bacterium]